MGREVLKEEYVGLMDGAECTVLEKIGRETMLSCSFELSCGGRGERVVFHREFYGAYKPAESFFWTIGEVCQEMLKQEYVEQLPDHLRDG